MLRAGEAELRKLVEVRVIPVTGLVEGRHMDYLAAMNVNAIVGGKLIKLKLSPGLAAAWKQNKGRRMSETEAVRFVETKRREHALRQASPYLASRA